MLVVATAVLPVVVACSDSESPSTPSVPSTTESAPEAQHGPVFPECGGISDETIAQLTQVRGLVNTARTSVGCQWLVGGGIIAHGIHDLATWIHDTATGLGALPTVGAVLGTITPTLINAVVGVIAGGLAVGAVHVVKRMRGGVAAAH